LVSYLKTGEVELSIDYKPAINFEELDKRLQKEFTQQVNKTFKNALIKLYLKVNSSFYTPG